MLAVLDSVCLSVCLFDFMLLFTPVLYPCLCPLINIFGAIRLSSNDFHDIALGLTSGTDTHPSNPTLFGRHTLIYGGSRFRHVNGYWEPNGYLNEAIEK